MRKSPELKSFFPVFYNIREDTGIILRKSNVRKICADPNTVALNPYDFLIPQRQFPGSWDILCVHSTVLQKVLKLSRFNRMCEKICTQWKLYEWIVRIFFYLQKIYAGLKNFSLLLELFCNNFCFKKFMESIL